MTALKKHEIAKGEFATRRDAIYRAQHFPLGGLESWLGISSVSAVRRSTPSHDLFAFKTIALIMLQSCLQDLFLIVFAAAGLQHLY